MDMYSDERLNKIGKLLVMGLARCREVEQELEHNSTKVKELEDILLTLLAEHENSEAMRLSMMEERMREEMKRVALEEAMSVI